MTTQKSQNDNDAIITENKKPLPKNAAGLCWGGFFLTWIWGIGNRTYRALWCLVPIVSIIMRFVILFKGREWAWENGSYENVEQFNRAQRTWSIVGLILFFIGFVPLVIILSFSHMLTDSIESNLQTQTMTTQHMTSQTQAAPAQTVPAHAMPIVAASSVKIRRYYCTPSAFGTLVFNFNKRKHKLSVFSTSSQTCMGPWRSYSVHGRRLHGSWGTRAWFNRKGKVLNVKQPGNWAGVYLQCNKRNFRNPC